MMYLVCLLFIITNVIIALANVILSLDKAFVLSFCSRM